jgi:hypothetical protein
MPNFKEMKQPGPTGWLVLCRILIPCDVEVQKLSNPHCSGNIIIEGRLETHQAHEQNLIKGAARVIIMQIHFILVLFEEARRRNGVSASFQNKMNAQFKRRKRGSNFAAGERELRFRVGQRKLEALALFLVGEKGVRVITTRIHNLPTRLKYYSRL